MRYPLSLLAVAAATAAVIWSVVGHRADVQASRVEQLQATVDELRSELRQHRSGGLGAELAAARDVTSLARREARDEALRAIDERSGGDQPAASRAPPVSFEQSQTAVFAAFAQEPVDPRWSDEAVHKLDAAVREHLPKGSRLGSIQCHTTMCQVDVFHTDPGVAQRFLMDAFLSWPGSLFVAKERNEQGEHAMTIIASREGHEPPLAPR
jgi:hypothetical protein